MINIKRLYIFLLKTFIPMFLMVFLVCLFIIMMQFLWRMIDEFVGKGLGLWVIVQFFFYASLTFVPMTLPLAVLLSSLMTLGNLGEKLELIAMKAAGVSLFQIMKPLIASAMVISLLAFYFQNVIAPIGEVKLYTLLYSIRDKSPEVEIPVGVFYDELNGYNIYIDDKDTNTGMLYGVMIYNFSNGFEKSEILVADSGKMKTTDDKLSLLLTLYSGESFSNGEKQFSSHGNDFYVREAFSKKETAIRFDGNFELRSEERLSNSYLAKNVNQLHKSALLYQHQLDSINDIHSSRITSTGFLNVPSLDHKEDSTKRNFQKAVALSNREKEIVVDIDSIRENTSQEVKNSILVEAKTRIERTFHDMDYNVSVVKEKEFLVSRHNLEWHRKFTLSLACLVFFFIGAPLGAIIGKGGFGSSATISVLFFVLYYFIDHSGENMARTAALTPAQGMWLSTFVLLPLGIFLTYKAVTDSIISASAFSFPSIKNLFKRPKRYFEYSDSLMGSSVNEEIKKEVEKLLSMCNEYEQDKKVPLWGKYKSFWLGSYVALDELNDQLEHRIIPLMKECKNKEVLSLAPIYPLLQIDRCKPPFEEGKIWIRRILFVLFPIGILYFFYSLWGKRILQQDLSKVKELSMQVLNALATE